MSARKGPAILAALALTFLGVARLNAQQPVEHHQHPPAAADDPDKKVEQGAVHSMMPGHHHDGPHIKLTAPRPQTPEDLARADAVVKTLRAALEKYRDYRVALADGYRPFLLNIPQPQYHFTNYRNGFLEAFTFDPAQPTSLLYKKTRDSYELIGAMYTIDRKSVV